MSARHLTIVANPAATEDDGVETLSERIRRLQTEARDLAKGQIGLLCVSLAEAAGLAGEIADGGEAYPVGARELCRRLCDDLAFQVRTLSAITERTAH